jgi:hypothetical protein
MAEPNQIIYTYKELATLLVKERNFHEGIWGLWIKFGLKAANVGAGEGDLVPSAIIPVLEIGLQKMDKVSNIAVDAAVVNPVTKNDKKRTSTRKAPRSRVTDVNT